MTGVEQQILDQLSDVRALLKAQGQQLAAMAIEQERQAGIKLCLETE